MWVCGEHRGQGLVEGHAARTANAQRWAYPRLVQRIRRALLELLKVPMQPGRELLFEALFEQTRLLAEAGEALRGEEAALAGAQLGDRRDLKHLAFAHYASDLEGHLRGGEGGARRCSVLRHSSVYGGGARLGGRGEVMP